MTDSKVISRLMAYAPPVLAAYCKERNRCIAATALGCDVLAHFHIPAAPFPVVVEFCNAAYVAAAKRGADLVTAVARGGHVLVTATDAMAGPGWPGHLMLYLPTHACLLDLDFQQFDRPKEHITTAAVEIFKWPIGSQSRTFESADGARMRIDATDDDRYTAAVDWSDVDRRARMVDLVIRAIRKDKHPCIVRRQPSTTCRNFEPDHNGECIHCDEPADAHTIDD